MECESGTCPNNCYEGLWEIPTARLKGPDGEHCTLLSKCLASKDADIIKDTLIRLYNERYAGNRAPLILNFELDWLETNEEAVNGLKKYVL